MSFGKTIILIDDDRLIHMMWQLHFKDTQKSLHCFFSIDEFLEFAQNFSLNTQIFIDCNLANGVKGEIESEKIANLGFTEIHITTSADRTDVKSTPWVKSIQPKRVDNFKF